MRKLFAIIIICVACKAVQAQQYSRFNNDSIVTEAKRLLNARLVAKITDSWLKEQDSDQVFKAGGFFSYEEANGQKCIVFSNDDSPVVLATLWFTGNPQREKVTIDSTHRLFSVQERDLYSIKMQAQQLVVSNAGFKKEGNTCWNIIPFIDQDSRRVYVFADARSNGTVVFGNDYLLQFDEANQWQNTRALHQNTTPLNYREQKDDEPITTVHQHSGCAASCLTATDISTVMLYGKCANWKKHMVISKSHVSIWDCEKDELVTLSVKDWERQYK